MTRRRSGRELEMLVREIEEQLSPKGFTITSRELVYQQGTSNQIAEFDIHITGPVGSSSVNWLIECRDRPSEGPAPNSWIEQLVGRKDRFKLDKVFAVSTTGFAAGTHDYALEKGIYLRSVRSISAIAADFLLCEVILIAARVRVGDDWYGRLDDLGLERVVKLSTNTVFRKSGQEDYQDLASFIMQELVVPGGQAYMAKHAELNEETAQRMLVNWYGNIECLVDGQTLLFSGFKVSVQIDSHLLKVPIVTVKAYTEGDRIFGAEATFFFEACDGHVEVRARQIPNGDGTYRSSYLLGGSPTWWGRYFLQFLQVR